MFSFTRSGMIIIDYTYTFITKTAEVEIKVWFGQRLMERMPRLHGSSKHRIESRRSDIAVPTAS